MLPRHSLCTSPVRVLHSFLLFVSAKYYVSASNVLLVTGIFITERHEVGTGMRGAHVYNMYVTHPPGIGYPSTI